MIVSSRVIGTEVGVDDACLLVIDGQRFVYISDDMRRVLLGRSPYQERSRKGWETRRGK